MKEQLPNSLTELQDHRDSLKSLIAQRAQTVEQIGFGDIKPGTSDKKDLQIVRLKSRVQKSIERHHATLTQLESQIENLKEQEEFLPEREGLQRLHTFLMGRSDFEELRPFTLDLSTKKPKERENYYQFYLGQIGKDRQALLGVPIPPEIKLEDGKIYAVPKTEPKGEKPYHWLEFYSELPRSHDQSPFTSTRLLPGDPKNQKESNWRGLGEQLVADFVNGQNDIKFEDLVPFTIQVKTKMSLASYRIAKEANLRISLYENPQIHEGDTLANIPHQDEQGFYQWVDVLKAQANMPQDQWPKVASYRLDTERKTINAFGWLGPERQLLADYLDGNPNVKFENLRPIVAHIPEKHVAISLNSRSKLIEFYFPTSAVSPGEEVIIAPKCDDQGLYQWLELHKIDSQTNEPRPEILSSGRIIDGKIQFNHWHGPERQLFIDYLAGKLTFENLRTIPLKFGKTEVVTIFRDGDDKVYLVASKYFGLKEGDVLDLVPKEKEENIVVFDLKKEDKTLSTYSFDPDTRKFKTNPSVELPSVQTPARLAGLES